MTHLIEVDYGQLQQVAERFGHAADATEQTEQRLRRLSARLRESWRGEGSLAFFAEMEGDLLPAMIRLREALAEAQRVTTESAKTFRRAEEDAAALFNEKVLPTIYTSYSNPLAPTEERGEMIEITDLDQRTQLANMIDWARSLLEGGDLIPEQRAELEARIREAEAALAASDPGAPLLSAAGMLVVTAGGLLADDVTVVGVADDPAIPFVLIAAGILGLAGLIAALTTPDAQSLINDAITHMAATDASSGQQSAESKDFLRDKDLTDWEGLDPQDVEDQIPDDWVARPARSGGGTVYSNPGRPGEQIIVEPGWPNASDPTHGGPYIKVSRNGQVVRIPLRGNPALNPPPSNP